MALDPTAEQMLALMRAAGLRGIETIPIAEARESARVGMAQISPPPPPGIDSRDETVPGPYGDIAVRIYRPATTHGAVTLPALLFFHGGGWVVGDLETHDPLCRHLSAGADCVVVAVDYRLAPEHRFPAAVEDAAAAARWLAANSARLAIDRGRLAVCGDSAGGNLAAVVALMAGRDGVPEFRMQALIYPVCDLSARHPSYQRNGRDYLLTEATMAFFSAQYLGGADGKDWRASPLLAESLTDAPSALIYTAEYDVLCDEGEAYAERLAAAGVAVRLRRIEGHMHGFITAGGLLPVAGDVITEISAALRDAFFR